MTPGDLPARIAAKVEVDPSGCWLWRGASTRKRGGSGRYGLVRWGRRDGANQYRSAYVHRLTYHLLVDRAFPVFGGRDGIQIDHICFVKQCCNPEHLEPVTNAENTRRYWAKERVA